MVKIGLDMYLYEEKYLSEYSGEDLQPALEKALEAADLAGMAPDEDSSFKSITIKRKVGYWRKANAIHQWFVVNVQGGEDECKPHYVYGEQLQELYDTCREVLEKAVTEEDEVHTLTIYGSGGTEKAQVVVNTDLCEELLPTKSGFFFGGTGYDELYLQNLKHTMAIIDRLRDEDGNLTRDFVYQSSW